MEVRTLFIEGESPWENGDIESFNGKMRENLLNREVFETLLEAKVLVGPLADGCNTIWSHSRLVWLIY